MGGKSSRMLAKTGMSGRGKYNLKLCDIRNGKWRPAKQMCGCEPSSKVVTGLKWVETDLMSRAVKNSINVARVGVCGVAEYWHGFRDITHDAIECSVRCKHCCSAESESGESGESGGHGQDEVYTIDYSWFGKRFRSGRYMRQYAPKGALDGAAIASQINAKYEQELTLLNIQNLYLNLWDDYSGKQYSIVHKNCKDYAQVYFGHIQATADNPSTKVTQEQEFQEFLLFAQPQAQAHAHAHAQTTVANPKLI